MCGIAGVLTDRDDLNLPPVLEKMLAALRHRGPDDEGYQEIALPEGCRLGLAHSRLSIIDLSSAAHQPMHDPQSDSWIVYNGETYNHPSIRKHLKESRFHSTGDTETILKGWAELGSDVLGFTAACLPLRFTTADVTSSCSCATGLASSRCTSRAWSPAPGRSPPSCVPSWRPA